MDYRKIIDHNYYGTKMTAKEFLEMDFNKIIERYYTDYFYVCTRFYFRPSVSVIDAKKRIVKANQNLLESFLNIDTYRAEQNAIKKIENILEFEIDSVEFMYNLLKVVKNG